MLLEPGVVLGALDGEVQSDLQAVLAGRGHQFAEIVQRAQLRVDGVVTTLLAADGIGAARVVRAGLQAVVRTLAMLAPDGVDRREVQHVEAHVADRWQTLVHVAEGAVSIGVIGLRAREQLVPAGELGQRTFDIQRIDRAATAVLARVGRGHGCSGFRRQQQRHAFVFQVRRAQPVQQVVEDRAVLALGARYGLLQQQPALFQLQLNRHAGGVLLRQLVAIAFEHVPPGLDDELVFGHLGRGELALPVVVAEQLQSRAAPVALAFLAPTDGGGQLVVPIGEDPAGHHHRLADDRLGGEATVIHHRQGGFDGDARHLQGLFESRVNRRVGLCIAHRTGS